MKAGSEPLPRILNFLSHKTWEPEQDQRVSAPSKWVIYFSDFIDGKAKEKNCQISVHISQLFQLLVSHRHIGDWLL